MALKINYFIMHFLYVIEQRIKLFDRKKKLAKSKLLNGAAVD
jgi:hypothetical protein